MCMQKNEYSAETKLNCWSTGPSDPNLSKNKKNNITKLWSTVFFKNLMLSTF